MIEELPKFARTITDTTYIGGRFTVEWVLEAYRAGYVPIEAAAGTPQVVWRAFAEHALTFPAGVQVSRRTERYARKWDVSVDLDFEGVIRGCAEQPRAGTNWITEDFIQLYLTLHRLGYAHSFEVWEEEKLVAGVYGVATGRAFSAESVFHRISGSGRVALAAQVHFLRDFDFIDHQEMAAYKTEFGARPVPRREYLDLLAASVSKPTLLQWRQERQRLPRSSS